MSGYWNCKNCGEPCCVNARSSELEAENASLKRELEGLKNPSDGRCMEIGALREANACLRERIRKARIHVRDLDCDCAGEGVDGACYGCLIEGVLRGDFDKADDEAGKGLEK